MLFAYNVMQAIDFTKFSIFSNFQKEFFFFNRKIIFSCIIKSIRFRGAIKTEHFKALPFKLGTNIL